MRDFDKQPYSADEKRVAEFLSERGLGGGDDPIGFILASYGYVIVERNELQRTFDLQWKADQRAIKRWQEAHPGNDFVWPDRADMVVWLMEKWDESRSVQNLDK